MMYNNYNVPPQVINGGYMVPFNMQQRAQAAPMHSTLTQEELELMQKNGTFTWKFGLTPEEQARGHCNHYNGKGSTVVQLNEEDERHPGCDVLHCNQCNTTWTDMSTKDDEWWRNLGKDVVSAFQTLKYMNIIPYDSTRTLGDFTELLAKIFNENVPGVKKAWAATYGGSFEPVQGQQPFYNAYNQVYNGGQWGTQYGYQSMMAQQQPMNPYMNQMGAAPIQNPMMAQPQQGYVYQQPQQMAPVMPVPQQVPAQSQQGGYVWQPQVMQPVQQVNPLAPVAPVPQPQVPTVVPSAPPVPAADQKKAPAGAASAPL